MGRVRRRYLHEGLEAAVFGYVLIGAPRLLDASDEARKPLVLHADVRPNQRNAELRRDYEYRRLGTANAPCCIQPPGGRHHIKIMQMRDKLAFAEMMRDIPHAFPTATRIHCVLDNSNTHSAGALIKRFNEDEGSRIWDRSKIHFAPKHASWLNQAEIQISMFSRKCFSKRGFASVAILAAEAKAWKAEANLQRQRIKWRFTTRDARRVFKTPETTGETRSET